MHHKNILVELQYLGSIQYYSKFLFAEQLHLEQMENYSKGSFRNRVNILTANGIHCLSIPLVKGKHQQTNIRAVQIDYSQNWQQVHWRSIRSAYGRAPFFEYYAESLALFYEKKYNLLFDFCLDLQNHLLKLLNISADIRLTATFEKTPALETLDLRNKILPKNYQHFDWDKAFRACPYPQVFEDRFGFSANLSILDLLFCVGPEAIYYLQQSVISSS